MSLSTDAKLAIQELLSRAAYSLDERIEDVLAACFAEDAEFSLRIAGGDLVGPFTGREGIMTLMTDSFAQQTDQRRHVVSNIFFESWDKQKATVLSNLTLFATENDEIRLITAGVYKDEVVHNDGEWLLHRRHLNLDLPY
ncbi:MAG: nuclear transport factor 2 family protein [Pseudomonadales bacterium]